MLLTLTLVVLSGTILVFFSEEFIKALKRLFSLRGAKLFIPLFIASWLVYTFDFWFLWSIFYLSEIMHYILSLLVSIIPFQRAAEPMAMIILLTFFSVVPVWLIDIHSRKTNHKAYKHPYVTSGIIWIFCVVALIVI